MSVQGATSEKKAKVYKPPKPELKDIDFSGVSVFLAGSIEMGKAKEWQNDFTNAVEHLPITVLNPRRDNWDPTWEQRESNEQFRTQVTWELVAQEKADVIAMFLQPGTNSPISLLELGLFAHSGKLIVCCPEDFYRRGNVEITCKRYGIRLITREEDFFPEVIKVLEAKLDEKAASAKAS